MDSADLDVQESTVRNNHKNYRTHNCIYKTKVVVISGDKRIQCNMNTSTPKKASSFKPNLQFGGRIRHIFVRFQSREKRKEITAHDNQRFLPH